MVRDSTSPGPRGSIGPSQGRRSSVQPQAARPFRGRGNVHVGRRTGVLLPETGRLSDGFEDINNIFDAAEKSRVPLKRKRRLMVEETDEILNDYISEHGEESMDLESPIKHYGSPPSTVTTSRGGRPSGMSTPGSSTHARFRKSLADVPDFDNDDDDDENEPIDYDIGGGTFEDDYDGQTSFSQMNADDDDESVQDAEQDEPDIESPVKPLSSRDTKGKGRALSVVLEEEEEEEDGDEGDMNGASIGAAQDDSQEEEEEEPPQKKSKTTRKGKGKPQPAQPRTKRPPRQNKKENRYSSEPANAVHEKIRDKNISTRAGVRRSKRYHMKPLEWWRLEKVVYGRPTPPASPDNSDIEDNDPLDPDGLNAKYPKLALPHIKEVIRLPKEDVIPLGKAGRKRRAEISKDKGRSRSRSRAPVKVVHEYLNRPDNSGPTEFPEEGWDEDTDRFCQVLSWPTQEGDEPRVVDRKIAFPSVEYQPKRASNRTWLYQKTFGDADFVACGFLVIPAGGRKPSKGSKDNTYMFYVVEGAVNLAIYQSNRIIVQGGMFMIPRGNTYYIENISNRNAKLVFTQARKMKEGEEDQPQGDDEREGDERTTVDRDDS